MKIRKSFGEKIFDIFNNFIMLFWMVITAYPLVYVLFSSVSDAVALSGHRGLLLYPLGFRLDAYRLVFKHPLILSGYLNTLIVVLGGTALNIIMTCLAAYFLSRKHTILLKNAVMVMMVFTMFFGGGLIPNYLLVSGLGMRDSLLALIIPGAVSAYNVIIMRTSFMAIPVSLEESAFLDGANDFKILYKIIIPLSKSILAVIALWYGVGHWNSWFSAAIFLSKRELYPIQLIMREILIQNASSESAQVYTMTTGAGYDEAAQVAETIKYAAIIIATVPILFVYPYLQKHFVKGVMIGALKG